MTIRGDSPPTESEMTDLFASAEQPAQAERSSFTPSPYGVGGGVSVAPPPYLEETTANALRYGVPAVSALATGGGSLLFQAGVGALTSAAGEFAARAVSGDEITSRQAMADAAKAAAYNVIPVRRAAKVIESAVSFGGGAALSEAVGELVGGKLTSEDEEAKAAAYGNIAQGGVVSGAIGAGFGMFNRAIGKMSSAALDNANKQAFLSEIGIKNPALSQIIPEYAPITNRMAANDLELANKLASTESNITRELFDIVGSVPSNSEVASKIVPLMQTAEAAEAAVKQARIQQFKSKVKLDALEASPVQSANWQEAYETAALEQLGAVRREASAKFAAQQNFGSVTSIASNADDLTRTIVNLDDAVKDVSSALYSKTGLNGADEIVSRDSILRSARSTLKDQVDSPVGKQIINSIENLGKIGEDIPEFLSWNQFKNLRDEMSSRWASLDENYVGRAEAMAGKVYKNMGVVLKRSIGDSLGKENAKAFSAAQDFWYNWSQTRDSNFTRFVFNPSRSISGNTVVSGITASTLEKMASDVLSGNIQSTKNIVRAIDLVGKYSPESASSMRASVGHALRGSMIDKYRNDPSGLITALANQTTKKDVMPFIQLAGFGDKRNLQLLATAVRKYDKVDITPDVLDAALVAGDVVIGLKRGISKKKAQDAAALAIAGASEKASRKLNEARSMAKSANVSVDEANAVFNDTVNNPIFSVFTGKGKYQFSEEAGRVGYGTISDFVMKLSPDSAQGFMNALRKKDTQLADLVSRKILADELYRISGIDRDAIDSATKVDFDKLRRLFNPTLPQDIDRSKHLKMVVGDVIDSRMKKFMSALGKASPLLKEAKLIKRDFNAPIASTALGAAQPFINIPGVSSLGASVMATRIGRILDKPRFNLLTYMATDPSFLSFTSKADRFSSAFRSLPVQRSYIYLSNAALTNDMANDDALQNGTAP
tara:strand:+ start:1595 stop:4429 length:2835 start_codon:yes stop_codon:yes gene_type:complete